MSRPVLHALASRSIELIVAVTPDLAPGAARVVRACRDAGVRVGLWPMLANADGRWASAVNAARFCAFVRALLDELAAQAALPDELAIDLEPPIERMQRLVHGRWAPSPVDHVRQAIPLFGALVAEIEGRGMSVLAAVMPPIMAGPPHVRRGWQELLDTPVDSIPFARLSTMAYTSLLQGYSRGLVRRRDATAMLARLSREAQRWHGGRASVSIGAVGIGALGDERTYRSVGELVEDVGIVRAAGIEHLALFNLDGVLARPPLEAWLDALVHTPPATSRVPETLRASAIWQLVMLAGHAGRLLAAARGD